MQIVDEIHRVLTASHCVKSFIWATDRILIFIEFHLKQTRFTYFNFILKYDNDELRSAYTLQGWLKLEWYKKYQTARSKQCLIHSLYTNVVHEIFICIFNKIIFGIMVD